MNALISPTPRKAVAIDCCAGVFSARDTPINPAWVISNGINYFPVLKEVELEKAAARIPKPVTRSPLIEETAAAEMAAMKPNIFLNIPITDSPS